MKKKLLVFVILLAVISGTVLVRYKFGWGNDDPCIKADDIRKFDKQVGSILNRKTHFNFIDALTVTSSRERVREINHERREFACGFPPMAITDSDIKLYPSPVPHCEDKPPHLKQTLPSDLQNKLLKVANSVGKLQIVQDTEGAGENAEKTTFWGTAFVIAPRLVATTCHILDPLLTPPNTKVLELGLHETMKIEFRNPTRQCLIDNASVTCSNSAGLDVGLLKIADGSCTEKNDVPAPVSLDTSDLEGQILAVIGYGDLDHPVDADTDELYRVFKPQSPQDPGYDKFVMFDVANKVEHCGTNVDVLMDAASTTIGESGSVVVKVEPIEGHGSNKGMLADKGYDPLTVVGVHTCCSTFSEHEKGTAPKPDTSCAQIRRTFDNQDISISSVLNDPTLCEVLKQSGASVSCARK